MSATTDPNAPRRVSLRPSARRLRRAPIIAGAGLSVLLVTGAGIWVLMHAGPLGSGKPNNQLPQNGAAPPAWLNSDSQAAITAAHHPQPHPVAHKPIAPIALPHFPPPPGMTELELAARKKRWDQYMTDFAAIREHRLQVMQSSLTADTTSTPVTEAQNGGGTNGGALPGGVNPYLSQPSGGAGGGAAGGAAGQRRGASGGFGEPSSPGTDYLDNSVTLPVAKYEIKAGDYIKCRLITGMTNEAQGPIKAWVTKPVLDRATRLHILIPQGSVLIGTYDKNQASEDNRLPVAFTRVIFPAPGDESLDLGMMTASDQSGYAGFKDQVDHHRVEMLINAALLGIFSAGQQYAISGGGGGGYERGYSAQSLIGAGMGQQIGEVGQEYARQGLNRRPTMKERPGYGCLIQISKDIPFQHDWHPSSGPVTAADVEP